MLKRLRAAVRRGVQKKVQSIYKRAEPFLSMPGFFAFHGVKVVHLGALMNQRDIALIIDRTARECHTAMQAAGMPDYEQLFEVAQQTTIVIRRAQTFGVPGAATRLSGMIRRYPRWPHLVIHISRHQDDFNKAFATALKKAWFRELGIPIQSDGPNLRAVGA